MCSESTRYRVCFEGSQNATKIESPRKPCFDWLSNERSRVLEIVGISAHTKKGNKKLESDGGSTPNNLLLS